VNRPRWVTHYASAVAVLVFTVALAGGSAQNQPVRVLVEHALKSTAMFEDLQELCDRIGGRPDGSAASRRAVQWAVDRFKAAGVERVGAESFAVPSLWLGETAEGECTVPVRFPVRVVAAPFTPSTPGGKTLEARLLNAGSGSAADFEKLGTGARGAIVLVGQEEMKGVVDLFREYGRGPEMIAAARKAGVVAVLLQSARPRGLVYRHSLMLDGKIGPLPAAVISREHAARLLRLLDAGEVRLRLRLNNRTSGPYTSHNVVAEIPGREKPGEIVVLGAHLDSWDLGTGAEDNGVNAALVIEAARMMRSLGLAPRRTIRFVLFNAEEPGLWGSAGYVARHSAEMDSHVAAVVFDMGSGRTQGFFLNGRPELAKPVSAAFASLPDHRAPQNIPDLMNASDTFDFALAGVPNLFALQDLAPYIADNHAESDVFERVDQKEARFNLATACALVWELAENPERPAARQTAAEVSALIKRWKVDEQMKLFGQWEDWVSGKRWGDRNIRD
jgi:carboxypeptidase Q